MFAEIDFLKLYPRLGRIRHLGLFSFWLSIILSSFFVQKIPNHPILIALVTCFLIIISAINLVFIKIRRLNDFDFRGWWLLLCCIPLLGYLWALLIFCFAGTNGCNRFGDEPDNPTLWDYLLILSAPIACIILALLGFLPDPGESLRIKT